MCEHEITLATRRSSYEPRRASEGSASDPSLRFRSVCAKDAKLSCRVILGQPSGCIRRANDKNQTVYIPRKNLLTPRGLTNLMAPSRLEVIPYVA